MYQGVQKFKHFLTPTIPACIVKKYLVRGIHEGNISRGSHLAMFLKLVYRSYPIVKCFTHELPPESHHVLFHIRAVPWYSGVNCFTQEIVPGNPVFNALHKSWFHVSRNNSLHSSWQLVLLYVVFKHCITHTSAHAHTHAPAPTHTRTHTHTHMDMLEKCNCTRTPISIFIIEIRDKEVRRLDTVCSKSITGVFEAVNSSTKVVQFFIAM
jgi:hypothetical protein